MSPSIPEEVGSTARGFITTMSSQPVMLGMVIVVLAMIAMLWYALRYAAEARRNEFEMIFAAQKDVQQLLVHCVLPTELMPPRPDRRP
jgi:cytoskeletal protein RodZ